MKRKCFLLFLCLISVCLAALFAFTLFMQKIDDFGPLPERKQVVIESGMSLRQIGKKLEDEGVISSKNFFVIATRILYTKPVLAGEYSFPRQASLKTVMHILIKGEKYLRRLTIPEGLTSYQVVQIINNTASLKGNITKIPPNGTLLPETYYYSYGDNKEMLLSRMKRAMQDLLEKLWVERDLSIPLKSPEEGVILASLIEKETCVPEERARIASVFYNRLAKGIKLQSDPTVIYALSDGTGIFNRTLTSKDLKVEHPCNTYVIKGLPAEPIANPGKQALIAAFNPMTTEDLFFVANGRGGHSFAVEYKDHLENTRKWKLYKKSAQQKDNSEKQNESSKDQKTE